MNLKKQQQQQQQQQQQRPFTVVVEGNIGSGKTTFLSQFNDRCNAVRAEVLSEPVAKWRDLQGINLFKLMYDDPCRWSMAFQSYVQLTMMELHLKKTSAPLKMMERSVYSGRWCFIENLRKSGKLPDSEYRVLDEWYKYLTETLRFEMGVDLVVYLRTTPQVAWNRVKARARSEEKVIPLEYLKELHELHENWLIRGAKNRLPAEVLIIDADQDIADTPDVFYRHVQGIVDKMAARNENKKPVDSNATEVKTVLGVANR